LYRRKMPYELVKHTTTGAGWFYVGQAERATFDVTLPPEEIPGMSWFADRVMGALVNAAVEEEGGVILDTKVYYDPASWYDCRYQVITVGHGSPLAWTPIIIAALAVIGLAIIAWILHEVKGTPYLGIGLVAIGIGAGAFGVAQLIKTAKGG
jgi:hypothetical protein